MGTVTHSRVTYDTFSYLRTLVYTLLVDHVYARARAHTHIHTYTHIHTMHTHTKKNAHTCTHTNKHARAHTHTHAHTHPPIFTHAHTPDSAEQDLVSTPGHVDSRKEGGQKGRGAEEGGFSVQWTVGANTVKGGVEP